MANCGCAWEGLCNLKRSPAFCAMASAVACHKDNLKLERHGHHSTAHDPTRNTTPVIMHLQVLRGQIMHLQVRHTIACCQSDHHMATPASICPSSCDGFCILRYWYHHGRFHRQKSERWQPRRRTVTHLPQRRSASTAALPDWATPQPLWQPNIFVTTVRVPICRMASVLR